MENYLSNFPEDTSSIAEGCNKLKSPEIKDEKIFERKNADRQMPFRIGQWASLLRRHEQKKRM